MKKALRFLIILLLVFTLCSCSDSTYESSERYYESYSSSINEYVGSSSDNLVIVHSAEFTIDSLNKDTINTIENKALSTEYEGEVVNSLEGETYCRKVYKIKTEKFDDFVAFVDTFRGNGSKGVSTDDVTTTYNNALAKKTSLQNYIASLNQILEDGSPTNDEKITILEELKEANEELTAITNNLASYEDEANYSTVEIYYYAGTEEEDFFSEYFGNLGSIFVFIGKALLYILPLAGTAAIVIVGVDHVSKRIRKHKLSKKNNNNNKIE